MLSSANLVDGPIFSSWTEEMKKFSRPVFHQLFVANTGIAEHVGHLHALLTQALSAVQHFIQTPPPKRTTKMVEDLQVLLDALSEGISSLPSRVGGQMNTG